MNSFGRIFRVTIFGESHGPGVGIIIDGCPAGLPLSENDFHADLERRKGGMQKGTTPRKEDDLPVFQSGVFNGITTGAPIAILFANNNTRSSDYEKIKSIPRPGHADFVAHEKFGGHEDYRGGGHFSGRLTVCLVAAGVVAKKILKLAIRDLTPNPPPKERERGPKRDPGYMTNRLNDWIYLKNLAKENRQKSTEAEEIIWEEVRNRKIDDNKFRRQHSVHGYIPDFVCLEKKLIIEIDGGYHDSEAQQKLDEFRNRWLAENGYSIIRFTNEEVLKNSTSVVKKIREKLASVAIPQSSIFPITTSPSERGSGGEVPRSIEIFSKILEIGGEPDIEKGLQKAIDAKDSVGGIIQCTVTGLPIGIGEPFFDSVESVISHAVFSIPAIKGIDFGAGFGAANMFGSQHNDPIINAEGKTKTNHAGGIVGGISNGNDIVFRVVVKPTSSTPKEQESWNTETGKVEKFSVKGRHDLCIALRVPPVLEAVTAMVIVDLMMMENRIMRVVE
jgi:chorismate synthase